MQDSKARTGLLVLIVSLLAWIAYQDLILPILFQKGMPIPLLKIGLLSKDLFIVLLLGILISRFHFFLNLPASPILFTVLYYGAYVLLFFGISTIEFYIRVASLRALALPIILFLIGYVLEWKEKQICIFLFSIIIIGISSAIFGIFERFLLPITFWQNWVGIGNFVAKVKGAEGFVMDGVQSNIMSDFGRRMVGSFGNPLSFAYFLVVPLWILISSFFSFNSFDFYQKKMRWLFHPVLFCLFLIAFCLWMSICRAVILALIPAGLLYLILEKHYNLLRFSFFVLLCGAILTVPIWWTILMQTIFMEDSSALSHWLDFSSGLKAVLSHPLGLGVGSAGAWSIVLESGTQGPGEVSYFVVAYQLGWFGLILFWIFWGLSISKLGNYKYFANPYQKILFQTAFYSSVTYFLTGWISEQIFTFTSVAHFWLILGLAVRQSEEIVF